MARVITYVIVTTEDEAGAESRPLDLERST
jgi:hypothetical protein